MISTRIITLFKSAYVSASAWSSRLGCSAGILYGLIHDVPAPLRIQLPANVAAADGSMPGPLNPQTGNKLLLRPDPALATAAIHRVDRT